MIIKSLRMLNFRQFKGETNIDFAFDQEENVTIILGDNTYGKTTLLQAFSWCLYESVTFDKNPDFLLNLEVANEMNNGESVDVEVELVLVHSGIEYIISRKQMYVCNNSNVRGAKPVVKVLYKQPDGQMQPVKSHQIENVINSILPKDLSTYFFFDTERVRNISKRKDVAEAVKGLLGLTAIENAITHLGSKSAKTSVIGKLYNAMDVEGDSRAKEALLFIQDAENKRDRISSQMKQCLSQIDYFEGVKEQLETFLREEKESAALQKRKEALERSIEVETTSRENTIKAYLTEFNTHSLNFYAQPLLQQALDFLREAEIDDVGIKDLTAVTIHDIIKSGKCICGQAIKEGNEAYEHLQRELAFVPPESIGNAVRNYIDKLNSFGKNSDQYFDSMKSRYEELYRAKSRIEDWRDECEDISRNIIGKEDIKPYELRLVDAKKQLKELQKKKDELIRSDEREKNNIYRYQKLFDSLTAVSEKNKETRLYIKYAEEIKTWLSESLKENEDLIRERLEDEVNKIFNQMYHGNRRVVIDNKYQVTLLSTIANTEMDTGESEGSNRVKNFAFIAGLVALAKDKIINSENELDLSSEAYPLVMDAPFSNTDERHTGSISKVLPEIAEQVIMFVMQKDWRYAEPLMINRVGKTYKLLKYSETFTQLKGE